MIDKKCKECLIKASHDTLANELEDKKITISPYCNSCPNRATFVTLKINGDLHGCIGSLIATEPLYNNVTRNAISAAFQDIRFQPLEKEELKDLEIEISILTEPKPLSYSSPMDLLSKLKPSRDGVIISKGQYSATFLPQVWEQIPETNRFLSKLCVKAGLQSFEWRSRELEIKTYQVESFSYSYFNPRTNIN